MHIYDFITDKFQYQLKHQAHTSSRRFEETIVGYKKLFFDNLRACVSSATPIALDPTLIANTSVLDWLECARTIIVNDIVELEKLFDEVIDGYYLFIRGKHYMASLKYQDLLDRFEIAIDDDVDRLALFFRGFKLNPSRNTFDPKQYYHIPFNLRHLVGNQRFSFSGLPIIYIGASVADIYFEFDEFDLNEKNIALAAFAFNPISNITIHKGYETVSEKTKIFNITNEIYNLVNDAFLPLIQNGVNLPSCDDEMYKPNKKHIKTYFRKFIVSQLCTFPKQRNNSTFYEEYVIPQLFTEALSLHKYDGIIFPSTKFKNQSISSSTPYHNLFYMENLALFSNYNAIDNYDEMLMDNFEIEIIDLKNANTLNSLTTIKSISKIQSDLSLELYKKEKSRGKNRMNGALMAIGKKIMCYDSLLINGHKYLETTAGKMELMYTVKYLDYLTSCIRYLNNA
jgi:hypothetical protein